MMEHKHAEVLRAIADGKQVQYSYIPEPLDWLDYYPNECATSPIEYTPHVLWRIKPEPKPDVVYYAIVEIKPSKFGDRTLNERDYISCLTLKKDSMDNLKLTFDGESGKLVSAEVL
jgi:hypothetical protein